MKVSSRLAARTAADPGTIAPTEDWAFTADDRLVVLDGATARTATGCQHGIAWFTENLGVDLAQRARTLSLALPVVLSASISAVAALHPDCDLRHPGTPSAAVGLVRLVGNDVEYLILGDITLMLDTDDGLQVISDDRVSATGPAERAAADAFPIGSPEKAEALLAMKAAELAARNREGGYWIAATDPDAAIHSLRGSVSLAKVRRIALLSDGAARAVSFGLMSWPELLSLAFDEPQKVIDAVRAAESSDPLGNRWPRNKVSDDATVVIAALEAV